MHCVILLSLCLLADHSPFVARVVSIYDGDTITVLVDERQVKIRLAGIDAPEKKQAFGTRARRELGEMIHGREVRILPHGKDRYGRMIADVWLDSLWVNREMVLRGWAWWYRQFAPRDKWLEEAERVARNERAGLWEMRDPVPPWEWRRKPE